MIKDLTQMKRVQTHAIAANATQLAIMVVNKLTDKDYAGVETAGAAERFAIRLNNNIRKQAGGL